MLSQGLFVVEEFKVRCMMREGKIFQESAESGNIDRVPSEVRPGMFLLKVVPQVAAVDLESKIVFDVACVSDFIDGEGDFG